MLSSNMRRLIGVAGPTAGGKTTIARNLIEYFHADTHRFSSILADIARDIGFPGDKKSLQTLSTSLRTRLGEDVLARGMCEWVKSVGTESIVVEGIRRATDVELLANVAAESGRMWTLIFVEATFEARFARFNKRLADDGLPTIEENAFRALDEHECEVELPRIKTLAHVVIDNTHLTRDAVKALTLSSLTSHAPIVEVK